MAAVSLFNYNGLRYLGIHQVFIKESNYLIHCIILCTVFSSHAHNQDAPGNGKDIFVLTIFVFL